MNADKHTGEDRIKPIELYLSQSIASNLAAPAFVSAVAAFEAAEKNAMLLTTTILAKPSDDDTHARPG